MKVVDKTEEIMVNKQRFLLVPWLGDVSVYKPGEFDALVGHFDVSSKYLIKSYIEEHSADARADSKDVAKLDTDKLIKAAKSGDLVGSFVELAKSGGVVYAGHIHQHKEFMSRGREFVFVGSPY